MSPLHLSNPFRRDPDAPTLKERGAALKAGIARAKAARPAPAPAPSTVFEAIANTTRAAAADALSDARVAPDLRAAIEAYRDATLVMLLATDTSNEASEARCIAADQAGDALRAVPARSLADVRAKCAMLLPEILPDVDDPTQAAFLQNIRDDVERLASGPASAGESLTAAIFAGWTEWASSQDSAEGDPEQGAIYDRHQVLRNSLLYAADALPATRDNVPAKAMAAAWMEWVAHEHPGQPRTSYPLDGRYVFDIHAALTAAASVPHPDAAPPSPVSLATPEHDLSALTLNDLAHLHMVASTVWTTTSMFINAPFSWDERRENHSPLGDLIEAEVDRWADLATAAAEEAARREPRGGDERDRRLEIATQQAMLGGGPIEDKALIAELAAAWGA